MQDLKGFINKLSSDEKLAQKVKAAKDIKEVVAIAKKEGYFFSEDDLAKVAGGEDPTSLSEKQEGLKLNLKTGDFLNFDISQMHGEITQNVHDVSGSTVFNSGSPTVSKTKGK